jgi:hypothetical protein
MYYSTGDGSALGGDPASLAAAVVGRSRSFTHAPEQNTAVTMTKVSATSIHRGAFATLSLP